MYGCASLSDVIIPELENRTLQIAPDFAGLYYQWRICTKSFLGSCRKWEIKRETYDLNDLTVRAKLIDMGFVAKVKDKILP